VSELEDAAKNAVKQQVGSTVGVLCILVGICSLLAAIIEACR
jgi:hypothetical protein